MSGGFALGPAATPQAASERLLLDLARRVQRQPAGLTALVLLLSQMPSARPHHRRIARAMMQDTALRQDGQVFVLRNGDIVLVCRAAPAARGARAAAGDIARLPATLERLMLVDAPAARLVAQWDIAQEPERLVAYAQARLAETVPRPPAEEELGGQVAAIGALAGLAAEAAAIDMIQRQTAVLLLAARGTPAQPVDSGMLHPLFCELRFSLPALAARAGVAAEAEADPFLFRHLATRLDQRLLELVAEALGGGGPLDPLRQHRGTPPLHLSLALPTIMSDGFALLAAATRASGVALGVQVGLSEAVGDPEGYRRARALAADAGVTLALDGVSHQALGLSQPWMLGADLLKLDWSPRLAADPPEAAARLQAILRRCGSHRLVLRGADSEPAIRWGLAQGIRRFQGRHIDAMLAAARLMACPRADGCALRQCLERGRAVAPGGRAFCRNTDLLDTGVPLA